MHPIGLPPRVFVQYRYGQVTAQRLLDLAYLGGKPIAVMTWIVKDGARVPGDYAQLEPGVLRPSFAKGTFYYDGVAESVLTSGSARKPAESQTAESQLTSRREK